MKNNIFLLIFFSVVFFTGCSKYDDGKLWDSVNDLENRLIILEKQCREMNTNIASMKVIVDALQSNDYITNVTIVTKDGIEVGYKIDFKKHASITIYHGKNGESGKTQMIGIKQAEDGDYYWTQKIGDAQNVWLLDENGNKIKAKGENGITPLLQIKNDKWEVSVDKGITWSVLGEAKGDSFFKNITNEEKALILELKDGTIITLPKGQSFSLSFDKDRIDNIKPNAAYEINYTLENWNMQVTWMIPGTYGYNIALEPIDDSSGKIIINTSETVSDLARIYVTLTDGKDVVGRVITLLAGKEIHVAIAGTLRKLFSLEELNQYEKIKITGKLNLDDYQFLKLATEVKTLDLSTLDMEEIPSLSFYGSRLQTVILPEKLLSIPSEAFTQSKITTIKIPPFVKEIGEKAFQGCRQLKGDLILPYNLEIVGAHAFENCGFDGNLYLGAMLREIKEYAFHRCEFTGKLKFPKYVKRIGASAFSDCSKISGLEFDPWGKLYSIEASAFSFCIGLRGDLVLPKSLVKIGNFAFYCCSGEWTGNLFMGRKTELVADGGNVPHKFSLELGSKIFTYIGTDRELHCLNFEKIYFRCEVPPARVVEAFWANPYNDRLKYVGVPLGCKNSYSDALRSIQIGSEGKSVVEFIEEIEF